MKRRIMTIVTALALFLGLLPGTALAEGDGALPSAGAGSHAGISDGKERLASVENLNLNDTNDAGNLNTDSYEWKGTSSPMTLTLAEGFNAETVTLPDGIITIEAQGNSRIGKLAFQNSQTIKLTFTGAGPLTIDKDINIASGNDNTLTVEENAYVIANDTIFVGTSGGTDSIVTVNGTLIVNCKGDSICIYAGSVTVGSAGILEVSGKYGVLLNGMPRRTSDKYTDLFTIKENGENSGRFTADCKNYNIQVTAPNKDVYPKNEKGEIDASAVLHFKPGFLPDDCEARLNEKQIDLFNINTNNVYTGSITIHKNHEYSDKWTTNESEHWHACKYPGCDKKADSKEHSKVWGKDDTEHWQYCTICDYKTEPDTHLYAMEHDEIGHWQKCTDCGYKTEKESHDYNDGSDTTCNSCGYTRTINSGGDGGNTPSGGDNSGSTPSGGRGSGGGSGGSSSYRVSVETAAHGKITSNLNYASEGSAVTLTVTPDSGYVLDALTVTSNRGGEVELTARGGGRYAFTMPAGTVTVKAVFVPAPDETSPSCDGGAGCPSRTFTDLDTGEWYHGAVDFALQNHLMNGYGSSLFGPGDYLTRAQFVQILYNKEGRPAVTGGGAFTDVAPAAWYAPAVAWAAERGIVDGSGNGTFAPGGYLTREQMAVMLWRYAGSPAAASKELNFTDAGKASGYAQEALCWAVDNGVVNGKGGGVLDPMGLATRAQIAQILMNYFEE